VGNAEAGSNGGRLRNGATQIAAESPYMWSRIDGLWAIADTPAIDARMRDAESAAVAATSSDVRSTSDGTRLGRGWTGRH